MRQKWLKVVILVVTIALVLLALSGCAKRKEEGAGVIQVKGSDTMVNLGQRWAEVYMEKYPQVNIAVTGGGSGTGIAAMINGTADIAESSRQMKAEEKEAAKRNGITVVENVVALDGLSVAINLTNPIAELIIDQLADIFTGKVTNWKELGGPNKEIVALSRESNSGTHVYFKEQVLRKGNEKGPEEFGPAVLLMPSSQAIADEIAQNPNAIGYFGLGYLSRKVKGLKVKKGATSPVVTPTIKTVQSREYPISRPLFFYTKKDSPKVVQDYLRWVLSEESQQVVLELDFVPLKK